MRAAVFAEALKLRRSPVILTVSLLVVLAIPAMSYAFFWVAVNGGFGPLAVKSSGLIVGEGWDGYFSSAGQITAAALFIASGVATAWVFGREFIDRTFASLFGMAVGRDTIAYAKFLTTGLWLSAVVLAMVGMVGAVGLLAGVEVVDLGVGEGLLRLLTIGLLSASLGLTAGLIASLSRGYLLAIGALIFVVAVSQMAVLFGTGGWFPFAVPGLMAGAGAEGVPDVLGIQIALVPLLIALVVVWTARVWQTAEAV